MIHAHTIEIDIMAAEDGWPDERSAHVYVSGILAEDGLSRRLIVGTWSRGAGVWCGGEDGIPQFTSNTWRNLAMAIARHYRLRGDALIEDEGTGKVTRFSVAYGDATAVSEAAA